VGGIPKRGLVPGKTYWLLADSGLVGDLVGDTPHANSFLGRATYLGALAGEDGQIITIQQFTASTAHRQADHGAPVYLIVGTSPDVGKTTAGLAVLRTLLDKGHAKVIALKATGTSSVTEIMAYTDYGAAQVFDCVDFGLPSTHPSNRKGMDRVFDRALGACLSIPADAVVIECGGDILGANVPTFLRRLRRKRSHAKVILVARDALGALGATRMLRDMGLPVDLITGPCTDTPAVQQRTQALCRTAAMNLSQGAPRPLF
jgi:dethiobiotin synthetase